MNSQSIMLSPITGDEGDNFYILDSGEVEVSGQQYSETLKHSDLLSFFKIDLC